MLDEWAQTCSLRCISHHTFQELDTCYDAIFGFSWLDNVSTLLDAGHSVVAEMTRSRIQEGIDAAKRIGRSPFGYTVEDRSLQQVPAEHARVQSLIREVRKSREEKAPPRSSRYPAQRFGVTSHDPRRTTTSPSTTISGNSNERKSMSARRISRRLIFEAYIQSNPRGILNNTSLGEAFAASSNYGQNPAMALGNRIHYVRVMSRSWYRQNPPMTQHSPHHSWTHATGETSPSVRLSGSL